MGWKVSMQGVVLAVGIAAAAQGEVVIQIPGGSANLTQAINAVPNGGTIEFAAGTYAAPANGWAFANLGKGFTIRGAAGANVVLTGNNTNPIFRLQNTAVSLGEPLVFENLTIRNGRSTFDGVAGGITIARGEATFVDVRFENNVSNAPTTGGGGTAIFTESVASFVDCTWDGNTATNEGGGLRVGGGSSAFVHRGTFTDNRTNLAGHRPSSAGGAIHIGDATVRVANSRFDGNEAGFAGGAIFAIGGWMSPVTVPTTDLLVVNSTFVDNVTDPAPGVTPPSPTSGGAINVEDQLLLRVFNSRFVTNDAEVGGGISVYRSEVEVEGSVFQGNRAIGTGTPVRGFGGAIGAVSNDTGSDGSNNRPASDITVRDSLIQCRFGSVTTVGQSGGGIYVQGDSNRVDGNANVPDLGTIAQNRATLVVDNSALYDCDINQTAPMGTGVGGGGINVSLGDLTLTNSSILRSYAMGVSNTGGAARIANRSRATITGSTFGLNSADRFGGALMVQASEITVNNCRFFRNEISPGVSEPASQSFGAAIFTGPVGSTLNEPVTGTISNSVFSDHIGLPLFDDDSAAGPINDVRYNGNDFFNTTFGASIYRNAIAGVHDVASLNALVVTRNGGVASTNKSQTNNTALGSEPVVGDLIGVPTKIINDVAVGDAGGSTTSYLIAAWDGAGATLDGSSVSGGAVLQTTGLGVHTLAVGGQNFLTTITSGALPSASIGATPISISGGQSTTLNWTTGGTFLDAAIDQGIAASANATGSQVTQPPATTTYRLCSVTEEGGAVDAVTVLVDEVTPLFTDGFESGNLSAWDSIVN